MKNHCLALFALIALLLNPTLVGAQTSAFTYQGQLGNNGSPFNGSAEFQATLWDAATNGNQIAANVPAQVIVAVTNGLFTLPLDFGANFPGADRWLQLQVRTTIGSFTLLTPRQQLTSTPYAMTASNITGALPAAQLSGTIASGNLSGAYSGALMMTNPANVVVGSFTGNGDGLSNVPAGTLVGTIPAGSLNNAWKISGNAATTPGTHFLGTTDNQALEIKINNQRALRIEPTTNSPNLIGGDSNNVIASGGQFGSVIAGGSRNSIVDLFGSAFSPRSVIGGGHSNFVEAAAGAVIGGGSQNQISQSGAATIGGGQLNFIALGGAGTIAGGSENKLLAGSAFSAIGGGERNTMFSGHATIGGGVANAIDSLADFATISGGSSNGISGGLAATVPGGQMNVANGDFSFAAGRRAKANHDGAFVWADSANANFASSASNQFLIRASGGVGIGVTNPVDSLHVQSESGLRVRATTTGTGFAGFSSENSLGDWFAGVANTTNYWYVFENAPLSGARLVVKSGGNVGIGTTNPTNKLHVIGGVSATAFVTTSDRNAKENFAPVSPRDVLDKVAALTITRWNYKEIKDGPHMGPTAQDFYAAFGLGGSDTTITTVDPDGVALAAIQGLNQKLEEKETRIGALEKELSELKEAVKKISEGKN